MQTIQPTTEKNWASTFYPKPLLKSEPLHITWDKLPLHFKLPDDPVDDLAHPLLAEALREALGLISPTQLVATNFGIVATVNEEFVVKAPDWVYIPDAIPIKEGQDPRSYTPYKEGALPEIVMEFLSDEDGREYDQQSTPPYGQWFFYEQILKIPLYAIFNPMNGALEMYQLKSERYQRQKPDKNGRYWIESLELFLGVWYGPKINSQRTGYWLRWWDASSNLLLWWTEALEKIEVKKRTALEKAQRTEEETRTILEEIVKITQQTEKVKQETQEILEKAEAEKQAATLRTAKQMLQANVDIAIIMQVTGLDQASIEGLQK
jgi:hypothetical protein